tara:strand:- start:747 stop:1379 length:633 start_codon:yes stop_codon:yes gene_type:complete
MFIDPDNTSTRDLYRFMIGSVVPRPIAWVSTRNKAGQLNLAPFSFFNAFSVDPPVLGIGIGSKPGIKDGKPVVVFKDTLVNIQETEEFVVNIVNQSLVEKMNQTSADYDYEVSEFETCGLTAKPSKIVRPPRVEESPISFECRLHQIVELGNSNLVLGRVVNIHARDEILVDGRVDINKLAPVGRLGGISYCSVNKNSIFQLERPEKPTQ